MSKLPVPAPLFQLDLRWSWRDDGTFISAICDAEKCERSADSWAYTHRDLNHIPICRKISKYSSMYMNRIRTQWFIFNTSLKFIEASEPGELMSVHTSHIASLVIWCPVYPLTISTHHGTRKECRLYFVMIHTPNEVGVSCNIIERMREQMPSVKSLEGTFD